MILPSSVGRADIALGTDGVRIIFQTFSSVVDRVCIFMAHWVVSGETSIERCLFDGSAICTQGVPGPSGRARRTHPCPTCAWPREANRRVGPHKKNPAYGVCKN